MNILIIEDDKSMAQGLKTILEAEDFIADISSDGADGLEKLLTGIYDLALLDINLPKLDGFSVLNSVVRENINTPIIFLTARSDTEDKIRGLSTGAVDYITKPFDTLELIARIKLRIGTSIPGKGYRIGNTYLDPGSYTLNCEEKSISLTKKEFLIFERLIVNPGIIQQRDILISKGWEHDEPVDYRTLDVYISMLRKKLKYVGSSAGITTKRAVGYVLEETPDDF